MLRAIHLNLFEPTVVPSAKTSSISSFIETISVIFQEYINNLLQLHFSNISWIFFIPTLYLAAAKKLFY